MSRCDEVKFQPGGKRKLGTADNRQRGARGRSPLTVMYFGCLLLSARFLLVYGAVALAL